MLLQSVDRIEEAKHGTCADTNNDSRLTLLFQHLDTTGKPATGSTRLHIM